MRTKLNPAYGAPLTATMLLTLLLGGCGQGLMAPDAWNENSGAEAYLDQIAKQCGDKTIGGSALRDLVNGFQNDQQQSDVFIDLTTKLYFGKASPSDYSDTINSLFPRGNNKEGLECVLSLLPKTGK